VEVKDMPSPTVHIPVKNISFVWTESSDRSWLSISFLIWAAVEHPINVMAQVVPDGGAS
jgi:hypothetical protein